MPTAEEIKIANKTSRSSGAIGSKAITPMYVQRAAKKGDRILDFGAGKDAAHATRMNMVGLDVTAHEFGDNVVQGLHNPKALARKYDIVYASNVLNVQSSARMLGNTIETLANCTKKKGFLVVNYPLSPRKGVMECVDPERLEGFLELFFTEIHRVGGTRTAPLLRCSGVIR